MIGVVASLFGGRLFLCRLAVLMAADILVAGCSTQPPSRFSPPSGGNIAQATSDADGVNDPLEPVNRAIFEFNEVFQTVLLRPVRVAYREVVPEVIRDAIKNILANLRSPINLTNDLLQGEGQRAWETFQRAVVNTTFGLGGIMDVGTEFGFLAHEEDFGQTLAIWGVGAGPYIVIPFLGPSNPRDIVGRFADSYVDVFDIWADNANRDEASIARFAVGGIDSYSRVMDDLKSVKKTSIDYYAAIRSMYRQKRNDEIRNGKPEDLPPLPDIQYGLETSELPLSQ